jgi:hypothetical protein
VTTADDGTKRVVKTKAGVEPLDQVHLEYSDIWIAKVQQRLDNQEHRATMRRLPIGCFDPTQRQSNGCPLKFIKAPIDREAKAPAANPPSKTARTPWRRTRLQLTQPRRMARRREKQTRRPATIS